MPPKRPYKSLKTPQPILLLSQNIRDNSKKCRPGCKYPKIDSAIRSPEVSVIPRSAEECFLQPIDLTLHAKNNHLFQTFIPLPLQMMPSNAWI
nr:hypothetical protein HmN_000030400 [Hymenolepis microstoma]